MNKSLKDYLGFKYINCMFLDPDHNQLYMVTFGDEEKRVKELEVLLSQAQNDYQRDIIMEIDKMNDVALKPHQIIFFP